MEPSDDKLLIPPLPLLIKLIFIAILIFINFFVINYFYPGTIDHFMYWIGNTDIGPTVPLLN